MHTETEVERKFTAEEPFDVAAVAAPDGVVLEKTDEVALEATYYDTADLRLLRARITLRRRTGGDDEGWHLKLPAGGENRQEVHARLGVEADGPPAALRSLVRAYVREEDLVPVARLRTGRTVHRVHDGSGGPVLAEVADDRVVAEALGETLTVSRWREIEVELKAGDPDLLDALTDALVAAGATPAEIPSKLRRALDDRLPWPPAAPPTPDGKGTAAAVVLGYLADQAAAMTAADPQVRLDAPDAVHRMRVATRRTRSALRTFRPLLEREPADRLRAELRWLAGLLGDARDAEVMHARVRADLEAEPADEGRAQALRRVTATFDARYEQARTQLLHALDGPRYLRLLDRLDRLLAAPPLTDRAAHPAREELPGRVRRAWRAVRAAHRRAVDAPTPEQRAAALHELRKAAKRARYAAEAVAPTFGADATRFAAAMEHIQEVLGEHQDSALTRATLTQVAAQARAAGEDTFSYGRLTAREEARAEAARRALDDAWAAARKKKVRAWL